MPEMATVLAYLAGLVLTLALAARFTPGHWWRRANARALAVLAGGGFVIGSALAGLLPDPPAKVPPLAESGRREPVAPMPGRRYRVFDDLNLRVAPGVHARRLLLVPAGTPVTTSGRHEGDWWEIRAMLDGRAVTGWSSSLWLRRADEGAPPAQLP